MNINERCREGLIEALVTEIDVPIQIFQDEDGAR